MIDRFADRWLMDDREFHAYIGGMDDQQEALRLLDERYHDANPERNCSLCNVEHAAIWPTDYGQGPSETGGDSASYRSMMRDAGRGDQIRR